MLTATMERFVADTARLQALARGRTVVTAEDVVAARAAWLATQPLVTVELPPNFRKRRGGGQGMDWRGKADRCDKGHPFSGDNVKINARGHRVCMECQRNRGRARRAAFAQAGLTANGGKPKYALPGERIRGTETECKRGHLWTENTYLNKRGVKVCRACRKR